MNWPSVRMGDLLSLEYGKPLPRATRIGTGSVPVAGSHGVDGFHDVKLVPGPGIVVGRKGSAGKVTWFEAGFWPIDTTYFVAHDDRTTDWRWLYYLLQNAHLERLNKTTGVPGLNRNDAYAERALLPPLSEQRRIVEILDQADALRKLRREADAKAARILPALFLKMFGDPATNPMGWPTDRLDKLFNVVGGGTPAKSVSEFWAGDIPWASPKDMKVDVVTDTEDHVTADAITNSATKLVERGSVLIVYRSGILAHTFPVCIAGRPLTLNQDLKALQARGQVSNDFIYGWLVTGQKLALSFVKKGATVHNIDGPRFLSVLVPKPPEELQERFASHLRALLGFKSEHVQAANQIEQLFSLLLNRAFSGQLTARWRQAHMQELLAEMQKQARLLKLPSSNIAASAKTGVTA